MPHVAIIIVNWNGKADTLECLASLAADLYADKTVYVVDNGSKDDSAAVIRAAYPEVRLIETGQNLGFTGGNNVGIAAAIKDSCDYVYLLNNDTTSEPDAITQLIKTAQEHFDYGILTPLIHYYDTPDQPWFAGSRMELENGIVVHDNSAQDASAGQLREIPWASGCAMLIPASLIQKLQGFDDRYFLNWEDVDLCMRVKQNNYKIGIVHSAKIYHKVNRSIKKTSAASRYYYIRSQLLFLSLHAKTRRRKAMFKIACREFKLAVIFFVRRKMSFYYAFYPVYLAFRDYTRKKFGALATKL